MARFLREEQRADVPIHFATIWKSALVRKGAGASGYLGGGKAAFFPSKTKLFGNKSRTV
jgi:hypothetical protein